MFPYLRILLFMSSVVLLYFFWEWGGAKILLESVHPPASVTAFLVGKPAPELHVGKSQMWSKQDFHLRSQRGNPVIVHFWATWCVPCKAEIPWFQEFGKKYKDQGFAVLGVFSWSLLVTAALSACAYGAAFGALQMTPLRVAPGLADMAEQRTALKAAQIAGGVHAQPGHADDGPSPSRF